METLEQVAYQEGDGAWRHCVLDPELRPLDETTSRKIRALQIWLVRDPVSVLDVVERSLDWDDGEGWSVKEETPPPSPKRKRGAEDEGEEDSGVEKGSPVRAIKKARTRAEHCAYSQQY